MKLILALFALSLTTLAWSLPAPKYLSVPQWKSCAGTVTQGSAEFVCLPSKKPAHCPPASWKLLKNGKLINSCLDKKWV